MKEVRPLTAGHDTEFMKRPLPGNVRKGMTSEPLGASDTP